MSTFKPTWLYIKQHNTTGLKYFGKTTNKKPAQYSGSGKYWKRHIKIHGNDVTTTWTQLFTERESLIEYALKFSSDNNIVESDEWANLTVENGIDGNSHTGEKNGRYGKEVSAETRKKISEANKGKTRGWAWWNNGSESVFVNSAPSPEWIKGRLLRPLDPETKERRRLNTKPREKYTCSHCSRVFDSSSYTRYHGDNCRSRVT